MDANEIFLTAIKSGDRAQAAALLEQQPALAEISVGGGISALLLAVYYGKMEIAGLLAARKAHLDIFEAAALGNVQRLKAILNAQPEQANSYAVDGFQPLGLAAFFGHFAAVEYLLGHGAAVNSASKNPQQVMALHSAVAGGHIEITRLLLAHGAQVNAIQQQGFTALHAAAESGDLAMIELLLAHGADPNRRNSEGKTPLFLALQGDHAAAAGLLRRTGALE